MKPRADFACLSKACADPDTGDAPTYELPVDATHCPRGHKRLRRLFNRIGVMTRQLHDTLRELGYDRSLQEAAHAIPDARQRLTYIAEMTEQAASKVLNFLACPFDALGSTMATYGAQNVGASRYDRLNKGIYSASLMGFGYSLLAFGVAWFFGRSLTGLFVSGGSSAQLVELAQTYMITNVFAYPLLTLVNVVRFMIQGMGFSMFAILAGVMEMAARSLAGMFLVPALGYFGAALGSPLAWVAADLFLVPAYFRCRRVLMSQSHHLHVMGESAESN